MATDAGIKTFSEARAPVALATPESPLPALRFRLKHLFWLVAIISVTLGVIVAMQGPSFAQLAMLLAVAVVALHVFGTALGTALRDHADLAYPWQPPVLPSSQETASIVAATTPSLLYCRGGEHRRMPLGIAIGATLGGLLGAVALAASIGERITLTSIAVGALSTAVIGAWFAFLGISFWTTLRQSWRDAAANER